MNVSGLHTGLRRVRDVHRSVELHGRVLGRRTTRTVADDARAGAALFLAPRDARFVGIVEPAGVRAARSDDLCTSVDHMPLAVALDELDVWVRPWFEADVAHSDPAFDESRVVPRVGTIQARICRRSRPTWQSARGGGDR